MRGHLSPWRNHPLPQWISLNLHETDQNPNDQKTGDPCLMKKSYYVWGCSTWEKKVIMGDMIKSYKIMDDVNSG